MTILQICLLQWDTYNRRMLKSLDTLTDEKFNQSIVADGNSPSWIFGHLVDTDDALIELFGIGKRHYPELAEIYHHKGGTNHQHHLTKKELTAQWKEITSTLDRAFKSWSESDWLARHNAVSEEDFKKEPQRNRLNVMLARVSHKASHLGQIAMQH